MYKKFMNTVKSTILITCDTLQSKKKWPHKKTKRKLKRTKCSNYPNLPTYNTSSQSSPLLDQPSQTFQLLHVTLQQNNCTISGIPVTLDKGQGNSNRYQTTEFSGLYQHAKFKRHQLCILFICLFSSFVHFVHLLVQLICFVWFAIFRESLQ